MTDVSEEEVEAAALASKRFETGYRSARLDPPETPWGKYERDRARAAITAAVQVKEKAECVVLDSYAAENQRFHDEIDRLQKLIRLAHALCTDSNHPTDQRIYEATSVLSLGLTAAAPAANPDMIPIFGATEPDEGEDVLGIRKGEE